MLGKYPLSLRAYAIIITSYNRYGYQDSYTGYTTECLMFFVVKLVFLEPIPSRVPDAQVFHIGSRRDPKSLSQSSLIAFVL